MNEIRDFAKDRDWDPWDIRNQKGFLRHLVIRESAHTDDVMVNLVTYGYDRTRMEAFAAFLQEDVPEVSTFIHTSHTGRSQNPEGEERVIFGSGTITDHIGDYTFELSPSAFFQTNTKQAERLYEVARDFADLQPTDRLYDLYCGAGTISLFLSDDVAEVVGVELVKPAVENARTNAEANGVENCTFVAGDLKTVFTPDFVDTHGRPDVLLVDPPRAGMHKDVTAQIAKLQPKRFVYVSCNPQTQARDLDRLHEHYRLDAIQPVDMFPHTPHIETVARLTRRGGV